MTIGPSEEEAENRSTRDDRLQLTENVQSEIHRITAETVRRHASINAHVALLNVQQRELTLIDEHFRLIGKQLSTRWMIPNVGDRHRIRRRFQGDVQRLILFHVGKGVERIETRRICRHQSDVQRRAEANPSLTIDI